MIQTRKELHIVFVTSFYDYPRAGTCLINNKLHKFQEIEESHTYTITALSTWEMIKAKLQQYTFELCVGKHWTYNGNQRKHHYYERKPVFLHRLLFSLYYNLRKK